MVVLKIYVTLTVFQPYRYLEAGDNQSLKFKWRGEESNPVPLALQDKSLTTRLSPLPICRGYQGQGSGITSNQCEGFNWLKNTSFIFLQNMWPVIYSCFVNHRVGNLHRTPYGTFSQCIKSEINFTGLIYALHMINMC